MLDPRVDDPEVARHTAAMFAAAPDVPSRDVTVARSVAWVREPDTAALSSSDTVLGDRPVRVYRPTAGWTGTVLFLHGGGWVVGNLDTNDRLCRALALAAGAQIVSLDYRLAPEHPFPAGLDDTTDALAALARGALDADPAALAVAGHSSGGNLAAAVARRARDGGTVALRHQTLLCPVLDHDLSRPSYGAFTADLPLTAADMAWYWDLYLPDENARDHPDASPLRVPDAVGLPPATIIVAAIDPLHDEALAYAEKLSAAGVPVELLVEPGVPHLYLTFPPMSARNRGIAPAGAALRRALA